MKIDNKYFSFCEEIGIMKENTTHQAALDTIIKEIKNTKAADPKFVEAVSRLTLSSPEVSVRACVLYRYDMDVDYVLNGNIKHTNLFDFGHSGVHDSLHITEYSGKGSYTVLKDASAVPYDIFNSKNLFTFEEMKGALTDVIGKKLPRGTTSFESKRWSVSAYFVPTLVVIMNYNGKEYQMYYNLQNQYYHWEWPDDPALIKKGDKAHLVNRLAKAGCVLVAVIAIFMALNKGFIPVIIGAAALIADIMLIKKNKKSKKYYQNLYKKDPDLKLIKCIKPVIPMAIITVIALIVIIATV